MLRFKQDSIACGDFVSVSKTLASNVFDLVIADFPYGVSWKTGHRTKSRVLGQDGIQNDSVLAHNQLNSEGLPEIYRLLKDDRHIYYFTRWDMIPYDLPALRKAGFDVKNNIIWAKNNWGMGDLEGAYANQYECILFAQKGRRPLLRGRARDVQRFNRVSGNRLIHSHQKPVTLLAWLIKNSTYPGEIVFDPTCGVGSVIVAAEITGRVGYGVELDPVTAEQAREYIAVLGNSIAATKQGPNGVRQPLLL
jgi:site-specific DNA-methyltransferase (adenine-specific)